jgi:hypothetical protein
MALQGAPHIYIYIYDSSRLRVKILTVPLDGFNYTFWAIICVLLYVW